MKKIFWSLILLTVASCNKEEKLPEGLMEKDEMVSLLIDIHLAQAVIQNLKLETDSAAYLFKVFEREVLENHKSVDTVFYQSFSWYLDHPDQMLEIYTAVVDTLSLRESLARRTTE